MIYTYQMEKIMLITTVSQAESETEYDHQSVLRRQSVTWTAAGAFVSPDLERYRKRDSSWGTRKPGTWQRHSAN